MTARRQGPLAVTLACVLACAAPAPAAEGLFLTWNDCAPAAAAVHDFTSTCLGNTDGQSLYCAFRMPLPADSVLGVEIAVDVQHAAVTLPDWWRLDWVGCRAGELRVGNDLPAASPCTDFLGGDAASGLQGYYLSEPRGGDNQAGIRVAASRLLSAGYTSLDASSLYLAARLDLSNARTTGDGACGGCLEAACLVLNSILVRRQPGAVGGDVYLTEPAPEHGNWVTWQGGTGADCTAVPARTVTWGRLKGLYR